VTKMIFVNLPVADIPAATSFYQAIGCGKNEAYSDEKASSMMWSDRITFQLLARDYFATFTPRAVSDARTATEVLIALTCETRDQVDETIAVAAAAGGRADPRSAMDLGFMYNRSFEDPDGHIFELVWMNPEGMPQQ